LDILNRAHAVGTLRTVLLSKGISVDVITDYAVVRDLIAASGKDYLTPFSSPDHNDFTDGNCIWLCGSDGEGPVMLGAARLEDLGPEPIDQYWPRVFQRAYPSSSQPRIDRISPSISGEVGGRLVYFGDLFVAKRFRGARENLQMFTAIGHLLCSLKWEPDWIYCFLRNRDAARGAAYLYGFCVVERQPYRWVGCPPDGRSNQECAAFLPKRSLGVMVESVLEVVSQQSECQIRP
jgi:hypothetical protein